MVTYLQVKFYLFWEQLKTVRFYYTSVRFALFDVVISLSSLLINPYRACRKFLKKKGMTLIDGYGETPYTTFQQLAEAAHLSSNDHYVELGSGRGKTCIWAASFCQCEVTGYEWVPTLFRLSKIISSCFHIPVVFKLKSMFEVDLSKATVAYLYSTQMSEIDIKKIPFHSMPVNSRIITVSQPHPDFPIIKTLSVSFPWGQTEAFIQIKSL